MNGGLDRKCEWCARDGPGMLVRCYFVVTTEPVRCRHVNGYDKTITAVDATCLWQAARLHDDNNNTLTKVDGESVVLAFTAVSP